MTDFVVLYRGDRIDDAKMVAVCVDPDVARRFAAELLHDPYYAQDGHTDPVLNALTNGKRQALRLVTEQEGKK